MLTSDPFQIISLIGFPKPQIFIFSPVLKARCDNTAAVQRYRRPRKQTQRRVRLLRFTKDAQKEMKRSPSGRSRIQRTTSTAHDCGGTMVRRGRGRGRQIRRNQTVLFFFHWKMSMWLVQREVMTLIHHNWRSQVTTKPKGSWRKSPNKVNLFPVWVESEARRRRRLSPQRLIYGGRGENRPSSATKQAAFKIRL